MDGACVATAISLRTECSIPSSFNGCTHWLNGRDCFADSSPRICCSSCFDAMCEVPRMRSRYLCNLFGLRQSSLIEWSHCRKLISSGLDRRYNARLTVCDVGGSSRCGNVYRFRERSVGWEERRGLRQCRISGGVDEAEVMLSLLAEDVSEEHFRLSRETRRLVKKCLVEKRDDCEVRRKCGRKKKGVGLGGLESDRRCGCGSVVCLKKEDGRREEAVQREEDEEALVWEENQRAELEKEHEDALWADRKEKEERKALLRKMGRKEEGSKGRDSELRKENWKVSSRIEQGENILREDHKLKARREGSCGSLYYTYSIDDYDSRDVAELREGDFLDDSSGGGHEEDSRSDKLVLHEDREEDWKPKDYREDHGVSLTKKNTGKEFRAGSIVECAFRKKSEKKLIDLSVQDTELRKEASQKGSKFAMSHESKYKQSPNHYASYDDRQGKLSMKFDDERKQQHSQTSDGIARQSETKMKYKKFVGMQDSHSDHVINSYGSQQELSIGKVEMSAKAACLSQKAVGKDRTTVGVSKVEDEYQRDSQKVARISEIQETDAKRTSTSHHRLVSSFKAEDNSANIHCSINDAANQQQQQRSYQVSGLILTRGESPQLSKKEGKSILKKISNNAIKQEQNLNLAFGSYLESTELPSQAPVNILEGDTSRKGSAEMSKISFSHSQDSGAIDLEGRNKTKPDTVHEEQQQNPVQYSSGVIQSKKHEPRHDDQHSEAKGPSDEMWNIDGASVQEQSRSEVQNDATKTGKAIVKGSGRSFWGIISDFVRLRWFPHSESHSSGRKTGGRNSPDQSINSETWFSGYEAEESEEAAGDKEQKSIAQGLSSSQPEGKIHCRVEEGSNRSTLEGHLKDVGIDVPSSSKVTERGSQPVSTLPLHSGLSETTVLAKDERQPKRTKLQQKDHFIEDSFDEWESVYRLEVEQQRIDETFMRDALLEAQKAADNWEVPVGAVLVHDGKIIARGCNLVEEMHDSTAHAEMVCIREASNILHTWRLSDTTLYVTLEPCPMCAGAILQARIDTVVWGAPNKLLGADGSWIRLFPKGDEGNGLEQTDKPAALVHPFHPNIVIRRGVLASECMDAMQQFFKLRRKNKEEKFDPSASPPSCLPIPQHPPKFMAKIHDALHFMFCL